MDTLGKRIKLLRGKESQDTYAARIGISKGSIGGYERDANSPSADAILKICHADDISVEWLLTGQGPMRRGEEIDSQAYAGDERKEYKAIIAKLEAENASLTALLRQKDETIHVLTTAVKLAQEREK